MQHLQVLLAVLLTICAAAVESDVPCCISMTEPEQVHLSFADAVPVLQAGKLGIRVTWVTLKNISQGVNVGLSSSPAVTAYVPAGESRTYTGGGWLGVVHSAVMGNLNPGTSYTYSVGSASGGWSKNFTFATPAANIGSSLRPLRAAVIADMGVELRSLGTADRLIELAEAGKVDVLIHSGDISYADGEEALRDDFWRRMEPVAARIPYMTLPGNHERYYDFTPYKARSGASMPIAGDGAASGVMFYSLQLGTVSMVMLNSESVDDNPQILPAQIAWAEKQLAAANIKRTECPWLWVFHHRPLYCTAGNHDCEGNAAYLRGRVEELYNLQKVDVVTTGHVHYWERMFPVVNGTVTAKNYADPQAPVYIVNGAAGNPGSRPQPQRNQPWSAYATTSIGYSIYTVSSDKMSIEFFDSLLNTRMDSVTITKTKK